MKRSIDVVVFLLGIIFIGCGNPSIQKECTVNGIGEGQCSFTNLGTAKGSLCGRMSVGFKRVSGSFKTTKSAIFCSGEVEPQSTNIVKFNIPGMKALCYLDVPDWDWKGFCHIFIFEPRDSIPQFDGKLSQLVYFRR